MRLPGRPSGLGCRVGPSVVAVGIRRGGTRWLAVGGTCGRTVVWGHGGLWRAHAGGCVCGVCGARACRAGVVPSGSCAGMGGGPVPVGMSRGRFSRLVEQEFEEVGMVRRGQGGCMLQVFVGAVGELFRCLGNGRPLHVCCRGLGVVRVGA